MGTGSERGVRLRLSIVENRGNGEVEGRKKVIECNRYDTVYRIELNIRTMVREEMGS